MSDYREVVRCSYCSSLVHFTESCPQLLAKEQTVTEALLARRDNEVKLIHDLILHPAGFSIESCGDLCIRRLEDPRWCVSWEPHSKTEIVFENSLEAVEFFVDKRSELQLGLDFDIFDKNL